MTTTLDNSRSIFPTEGTHELETLNFTNSADKLDLDHSNLGDDPLSESELQDLNTIKHTFPVTPDFFKVDGNAKNFLDFLSLLVDKKEAVSIVGKLHSYSESENDAFFFRSSYDIYNQLLERFEDNHLPAVFIYDKSGLENYFEKVVEDPTALEIASDRVFAEFLIHTNHISTELKIIRNTLVGIKKAVTEKKTGLFTNSNLELKKLVGYVKDQIPSLDNEFNLHLFEKIIDNIHLENPKQTLFVTPEVRSDLNNMFDTFMNEHNTAWALTKVNLAKSILHDVKTPLASLNTQFYLINIYLKKEEDRKIEELVSKSISSIDNAFKQLEQVDTSFNILPIDFLSISIKDLFEQRFSNIQEDIIRGNNFSLGAGYTVGSDLYWKGSEIALNSILMNLYTNSLKYARVEDLELNLNLEVRDSRLFIKFSDNGKGMSQEDLEQIFDKEFRADVKEDIEGSGHGMNIVKHLVEGMGGDITVFSNPNGTHTTLTFPLQQYDEA